MVKVTQVVASAVGAVAAAVIASFFGVKGTMIGVAVGSAVATTASALAAKSLERGHRVVRHVVIEQNPLVHRLGSTEPAGTVTSAAVEEPGPTAPTSRQPGAPAGRHAPRPAAGAPPGSRRPLARSGGTPAGRPPTSTVLGPTVRPPGDGGRGGRRFPTRWVLTGVAAFVVALVVVTLIELGAGRPLAALLGSSPASSGTTVDRLGGTGAPATTSTSTTSTSTTSTTPLSSTTSTTTSTTTTTTAPGATATGSTTTSTTRPPTATTTTVPATTPPGASAGASAGR